LTCAGQDRITPRKALGSTYIQGGIAGASEGVADWPASQTLSAHDSANVLLYIDDDADEKTHLESALRAWPQTRVE
jgi:hypothetical protein